MKTPVVTTGDGGPFEDMKRSDSALIRHAVRNDWPIEEATKERIVQNLADALSGHPCEQPWLTCSVCLTVIEMVKADQKIEHPAWERGELECRGKWRKHLNRPHKIKVTNRDSGRAFHHGEYY